MIPGISGHSYIPQLSGTTVNNNESLNKTEKTECQTCKSRKYQDGSNEMVSYKAPTHISPESSASAVMSHEQEHVSNAYSDASQNNGKVIRANVSLHTSICPECGRGYVSGGTTTTTIAYNEASPYEKNAKSRDQEALSGNSIDLSI